MTMRPLKFLILVFLLPAFPFICQASAYWMEVSGSGKLNEPVRIAVFYGNLDDSGRRVPQQGAELALTGEFKITIFDQKGHATSLPLRLKGTGWEGDFVPREKGVYRIMGMNNTHPVVDRSASGGKNILPVDYLCAVYEVQEQLPVTRPLQLLDIVTSKNGSLIAVRAFNHDNPAKKGTRLRVFNPENWEKELILDQNGGAVFLPTMKGLYIIRQDWEEDRAGSYKGVSYSAVRHRCNYFFLNE